MNNGYIERLSALNADGKFGEDFTSGGRPVVTVQEISGAMVGQNRAYAEFVLNIVHKQPTSSDSRQYLKQQCITACRSYEKNKRRLYKETKPLSDSDCGALANMALDWMIQGFHNETEQSTAKFASVYLSKHVPVSTWTKKYEMAFVTMLTELQERVQDVCNRAKEISGVYE